ncbi:MAG TPA: DUF4845 domain-containing protein [Casimicrobium huifangae]|nr:DUF4845 domain-containing protein [Casimicrobium huifangae]
MKFKHQRGLSLIGFILIAAIVAFVMFTAFRCVPAWTEYLSLKKVLQQVANEFGVEAQPPAIRASFDRRAAIDDLPVTGKEIDIRKDNGRISLSVSYRRQVPVAGNMSLLFDFDASATGNR